MIKNGVIAGLKPEEVRGMIPKDTWLVFDGWMAAHSPPKPGSDAMSADEYRQLVRRIDGD